MIYFRGDHFSKCNEFCIGDEHYLLPSGIQGATFNHQTPFCPDCPDHEACATGWPCWMVKELFETKEKK